MNNGPCYLVTNNCSKDNEFHHDELLYRRSKKTIPIDDHFRELKSEDLIKGLSVNRSKYSKNPADVLWKTTQQTPIIFEFLSEYTVFQCSINTLSLMKPIDNINIQFYVTHDPIPENIAHSLIFCNYDLNHATRKFKRDVKLFLATLFQHCEI